MPKNYAHEIVKKFMENEKMSPIVDVLHKVVWSSAPANIQIPRPAWGIFSVIHKTHQIWQAYHKKQLYTNPHNGFKLVIGHGINYKWGESLGLRAAAQFVLVASRTTACVEQMGTLHRACNRWMNAVRGRYPKPTQKYGPWECGHWPIIDRLRRILLATIQIVKEAFFLSMRIMDAIDAFSMDPAKAHQNINEIVANISECLDRLEANQHLLLHRLQKNRNMVRKILLAVDADFTVDQVMNGITKTLKTAKSAQKIWKVVRKGKKFAQHAIFGLASSVGVAKYTPAICVPVDASVSSEDIACKKSKKWFRARPISRATILRQKANHAKAGALCYDAFKPHVVTY